MLRTAISRAGNSRLSSIVMPLVLGLLSALPGCDKDPAQAERRYCDQSGCYACVGENCYPVPGDATKPPDAPTTSVSACDSDAACGAGRVCDIGKCVAACTDNSACKVGNNCVAGRCRPTDAAACGLVGSLCTTDSACASGSTCVNRACATSCAVSGSKCALGQVCVSGACVEDPSPTSPQCVFDADCGASGFRCINAYCLSNCTDNKQCQGGAVCQKGVCRGNRLPQ